MLSQDIYKIHRLMGADCSIQEVEKQVSDSVAAAGRLIRMFRDFVGIFKKPDAAVLLTVSAA